MKYAVKLAITGLLLFFILQQVNPRETWQQITTVSPALFLLALILQIASNTVAAGRWCLIMKKIGFSMPFSFFLKSYFKGAFFNQGLPTSIGGDGLRVLDCARSGRTEDSIFGVFIDRIIGLAGLLLLNIMALLYNHTILPPKITLLLFAILLLFIIGLVGLFFLRKIRVFSKGRYLVYLTRLSERYFQVYSSPMSAGIQISLSVLTHLLAMTAFFILGRDMGLDYPLSVYLVLVPPVVLLIILPISLAGWGIREGALVGFFLLIGADKAKVVSFSLLYGVTALVASVPGLFVYLNQKHSL
ncbi:MAG TPA: flippase-like domain-containing protein, partial [Desulfobulbaceae bacterium]|nr:flippase-like domain-containing protein [Desulfobulbaceae bacterium]